jgi:hypothetical protein
MADDLFKLAQAIRALDGSRLREAAKCEGYALCELSARFDRRSDSLRQTCDAARALALKGTMLSYGLQGAAIARDFPDLTASPAATLGEIESLLRVLRESLCSATRCLGAALANGLGDADGSTLRAVFADVKELECQRAVQVFVPLPPCN